MNNVGRMLRELSPEARKDLRRASKGSTAEKRAVFQKHVLDKIEGEGKDNKEWKADAVRQLFREKPTSAPAAVEAPKAPPVSLRDQPRPAPAAPINVKTIAKTAGTTPGTAWAPPPPEQGKTKRIGTAWKGPAPKVEEPPVIDEGDLLEPEDLPEE
ncbi:MAG: hypothetical protein ABIJ57_01665 [Pseudomonadota bacterium]